MEVASPAVLMTIDDDEVDGELCNVFDVAIVGVCDEVAMDDFGDEDEDV